MHRSTIVTLILLLAAAACLAQTPTAMTKPVDPLLCDTTSGLCELPGASSTDPLAGPAATVRPVRILYFTDPICSSCWGVEPQLRRLKLEYGHLLDIDYRMGGLLPDWSYNSGGISKPSDVAHHWDEVSLHYRMPIDGDVWLEDPLDSSYPPSIAFKAAQMQDPAKAVAFLRLLREDLFLRKRNITRWEHVERAARQAGLDAERLGKDFDGEAASLFREDLALAKAMGVRGFPTFFFRDAAGRAEVVYGFRPYASFEQALKKLVPDAAPKACARDWSALFTQYPTLALREYAELAGMGMEDALAALEALEKAGELSRISCRNGHLWRRSGQGQ
jgi:putative protein-disulfide isomerase